LKLFAARSKQRRQEQQEDKRGKAAQGLLVETALTRGRLGGGGSAPRGTLPKKMKGQKNGVCPKTVSTEQYHREGRSRPKGENEQLVKKKGAGLERKKVQREAKWKTTQRVGNNEDF